MPIEHFQKLKSNLELNPTFDQTIQQKHNAVRGAMENIDPNIKTRLIGSLARKTRIQPRVNDDFDIDILVELGSFYNWVYDGSGINPQDATRKLQDIIGQSERYSAFDPQVDHPTVTFEYSNKVKVELVPAYRDQIGTSENGTAHFPKGRAYWIPKNGKWVLADYDHDSEYISRQNQASEGLLIPVIKMLKAIRRDHFPELPSFHLEIIASHALPVIIALNKQRNIALSYPTLVTHFFHFGDSYLDTPAQLPGSLTPPLELAPMEKITVKAAFAKLKNNCAATLVHPYISQKVETWKKVFGEPFPTTVTQ